MQLITSPELIKIFGYSLGRSVWNVADKRMNTAHTKKHPYMENFTFIKAYCLESLIELIIKTNDNIAPNSRWKSKWRSEYQLVISTLKEMTE